MTNLSLRGQLRVMFLYDVAEAITLDVLRSMAESKGVELRSTIVHLPEIVEPDGKILAAGELLASRAREIAQLVRGDSIPLSDAERQEVLQSSISYSRTDLLVVGWTGALVYGHSEVAEMTMQMLEYANTQLLEFRHYDGLLTLLLDGVYRSLERKGGVVDAWRQSREAARLNTIRLDVMELTE